MVATPRTSPAMPFLPGLSNNGSQTARSHGKSQGLSYALGGGGSTFRSAGSALIGEKGDMPKLDLATLQQLNDPFHRFNMSARTATHDEKAAAKESARNTYRPALQPAWLKHDGQVLKFDAYFQEPVHENPKETFRIRCCSILFYLEDGTMMVSEAKVKNSGIPQGTFVKRHRIAKPDGSGFYTYEDLCVGVTLSVYNRSFRIVGCDDFTRHFYEANLNQPMHENEEPPVDNFKAESMPASEEAVAARKALMAESKKYSNIALGGNRKNEKLQQYLENDRKVLRFQCYWADQTKYGAYNYYVLHYYLADDSVELLENITRNAGRDPYPVFWRRAPLRKNPYVNQVPGTVEPEAVFYKPEDLIVGDSISVVGREVVLFDCDDFTRNFYKSYMSYEQDSMKIEEPKLTHVKLSHPPRNGFGSEEDSLASCLRLVPRQPRRDVQKLLVDADKLMRFEAIMVNDVEEDDNRRFIVGVYIADDSVCVWELKQRNSGHGEGKFASKSKKKNPATGKWFKPSDFFVGSIVEINSVPFHLVGADEAALIRMEEDPEQYAVANVPLILRKMGMLRQYLQSNAGGQLPCPDVQAVADQLGVELVDHELITLARQYGEYFPSDNVAYINASAVLSAMAAERDA